MLADEINRAPPKTKAALLRAMQEHEGGMEYVIARDRPPNEACVTPPFVVTALDWMMARAAGTAAPDFSR